MEDFVDYLLNHGINPIYFVAIFVTGICISYRDHLKRWSTLKIGNKIIIIMSFIGSSIIVLFALAFLFNIIPTPKKM